MSKHYKAYTYIIHKHYKIKYTFIIYDSDHPAPPKELRTQLKSPVRRPQQVRLATHGSQIGLRAFAPHDLYLVTGSNHGP